MGKKKPEVGRIKNFEYAMGEIEAAFEDVKSDMPELSDEDIYHDVCLAVMLDCTPTVKHSLARSFLGWDPEDDAELYFLHNIPLSSDEPL